MPERIQQRRTRGWRKPENTVSVARPGRYGNPFAVGRSYAGFSHDAVGVTIQDRAHAVEYFRKWLRFTSEGSAVGRAAREYLRGKNLMCFCPLDQPCHADVLLELANPRPLCPECRDGKPQNCTGWTLDAEDNEIPCATGREKESNDAR